jgi:hypothetical protein
MKGRIGQAMARHEGLQRQRMARLADRMAEGSGLHEAGRHLGLTRGQTARLWATIKAELGWQAS